MASFDNGPVRLLPLLAEDTVAIAEMATGMTGAQAHCVAEARRFNAILASYQPGAARGLLPSKQILDMDKPDDF